MSDAPRALARSAAASRSSRARSPTASSRRVEPIEPRRILIAHHLLLGDTLMLTPLLAKLRASHPRPTSR